MRILVTGAAGFIGAHLYEKLRNDGHQVTGVDDFSHPSQHPITDLVLRANVCNRDRMDSLVKRADLVYHLAAQIHVDKSIKDPQDTIERNVIGTLNVLEACREHRVPMVFASSSEVYGTAQSRRMDEDHPLDAQSPYAASKVAGDRLCKSYLDTYQVDVAILRNFNTFGPYQADGGEGSSYGAVIGIFTRAALRGEPLTVFGDGKQERDYMHISDALAGYELAARHRGVLNIGTGKTVSINALAKKIVRMTGSPSRIVHVDPRPGEVQRLCAGIGRARRLGFKPSTDFDLDLATYIEWYKEHRQ